MSETTGTDKVRYSWIMVDGRVHKVQLREEFGAEVLEKIRLYLRAGFPAERIKDILSEYESMDRSKLWSF